MLSLTDLFQSIIEDSFSINCILIIISTTIIIGLALAITYKLVRRKAGYSVDFPMTILLLPVVVSMIVYFLQENVAGSIALGGIFALTRFRSRQKDGEDITYICICVALGLIAGLGYIAVDAILAVVFILILVIVSVTKFSQPSERNMTLKIVVPESLNYDHLFDELLNKYCSSWNLNKVKTTDFGTTFELVFNIILKRNVSQKELIDEIRTRNANLPVQLTVRRYTSDNN